MHSDSLEDLQGPAADVHLLDLFRDYLHACSDDFPTQREPVHFACCGQVLFLSMLDLPFSISPVVTGLMLTLLYGRSGWFANVLAAAKLNIVFAFPGELKQAVWCVMHSTTRTSGSFHPLHSTDQHFSSLCE